MYLKISNLGTIHLRRRHISKIGQIRRIVLRHTILFSTYLGVRCHFVKTAETKICSNEQRQGNMIIFAKPQIFRPPLYSLQNTKNNVKCPLFFTLGIQRFSYVLAVLVSVQLWNFKDGGT